MLIALPLLLTAAAAAAPAPPGPSQDPAAVERLRELEKEAAAVARRLEKGAEPYAEALRRLAQDLRAQAEHLAATAGRDFHDYWQGWAPRAAVPADPLVPPNLYTHLQGTQPAQGAYTWTYPQLLGTPGQQAIDVESLELHQLRELQERIQRRMNHLFQAAHGEGAEPARAPRTAPGGAAPGEQTLHGVQGSGRASAPVAVRVERGIELRDLEQAPLVIRIDGERMQVGEQVYHLHGRSALNAEELRDLLARALLERPRAPLGIERQVQIEREQATQGEQRETELRRVRVPARAEGVGVEREGAPRGLGPAPAPPAPPAAPAPPHRAAPIVTAELQEVTELVREMVNEVRNLRASVNELRARVDSVAPRAGGR